MGDINMKQYAVTIMNLTTKEETEIVINADADETNNNVVLSTEVKGNRISASHYNYFPAYQSLRDSLLIKGYGMKCNGSRMNAIQTGMMGANDTICLAEMGKKVQKEEAVSIYEYADIDEFPDTIGQMNYFRAWMKSLSE